MKRVLVTGANTGIGLALVNHIAEQGHTVFLGARNLDKAKQAAISEKAKPNTHFVQLDITNKASVDAAVLAMDGSLDVLVNNAGVGFTSRWAEQKASTASGDLMREAVDINLLGTVRTTTAFLPLLRKSTKTPTIVFVASDMASNATMATTIGNPKNPLSKVHWVAYNTSKAALNSYAVALMAELHGQVKINCVTPGYTATALNNFGKMAPGARKPEDAAKRIAQFALLNPDGPHGKFFGYLQEMQW